MKANSYIGITIVAGFILIGYLYSQGGATQIPGVIVAIGVLCKLFQTDAKVESSIDVSTENAHAIAAVAVQQGYAIEQVAQQVDANTRVTETTHGIVNSQRTEMLAELAKLRAELAAMREAKATEETSEARIIAAVEKAAP